MRAAQRGYRALLLIPMIPVIPTLSPIEHGQSGGRAHHQITTAHGAEGQVKLAAAEHS